MGNPEDKQKARTRRVRKRQDRVRSMIAKDLLTEKYRQQVIRDKKKLHELTHAELVQMIQRNEDDVD